ncbi:MAG: zinc-binding dehydrogenase [Clostridiales Family XIII bacterium]|jgi:D-arabinose 1-dehydrogenase-like Zn-dependent alcohol dehydrogenase|nr:zinc-binding dehydrogenase [Clostridiales Family XIII bacterium]
MSTKTVKAAVLTELGKPQEIRDVPVPELTPGAILAKVLLAGVCGTDVHQARGELSIPPLTPCIQGHEILAEVEEICVGKHSIDGLELKPGDRIMFAHPFCGDCYSCNVLGQPYMCDKAFGKGYGFNGPELLRGGFAEKVLVTPETQIVKVPDNVPDEEALGVGCAFRTVVSGFERLRRHSPIGTGDTVVVQGAGPIGLYSVLLAHYSGASRVVVIAAETERLVLAKEWGAAVTINLKDVPEQKDRVQIVKDLTGGRGAEFVIEASGAPIAFVQAFDFMCKNSTYLVMGQTSPNSVEFVPNILQGKQACVIGSGSADARHFYKALQFISAHREEIDFSKMVSATYKLEEIDTALENMRLGKDVKGAIDNRGR